MQMWNFVTWKPGHPSKDRQYWSPSEMYETWIRLFFLIFCDWCAARKKILTMRRLWEKLSVNHRHIILELFWFLIGGLMWHLSAHSYTHRLRRSRNWHLSWMLDMLDTEDCWCIPWDGNKRTESICKRVCTPDTLGFCKVDICDVNEQQYQSHWYSTFRIISAYIFFLQLNRDFGL